MRTLSLRERLAPWQPLPPLALALLFTTALFFSARLGLLFFLLPDITHTGHIARALYIGLKFDARWAVFLTLPLAVCLLIPALERRVSAPGRAPARVLLCGVQALLFSVALLIVILDFGFFFYLHARLDMSALAFAEDPLISAAMVWQTYPVLRLLALFILAVALYGILLARALRRHVPTPVRRGGQPAEKGAVSRARRGLLTLAALIGLFVMGYGQISSNLFPLRWSNAYFSADGNIALLALNPMQNLYDTRHYGEAVPPDPEAAADAWPRMAAWLRLPPGQKPLTYARAYPVHPDRPDGERLNVVIIVMESLAWPRTSLAPAPAGSDDGGPTPFLAELAGKSLYYPNFYAPTRTTARAIFTSVSGVPDVNHTGGTTSRNPRLVEQSTILNEFQGYEKYYMIGGNANWANIRGLFQHNVEGLRLLEESAWKAPNVDVWGISDLALLREATEVLSRGPKPFVAFIQTAGFHRPYTIPDDNEGYVRAPEPTAALLRHYGFENPEEYQSIHFADWALRRFFERASREPWFDTTLFAIFGDHGLNNSSANISPGYLACGLQAWHIPLLLYAPGGQIAPGVNTAPHTQLDVLPTLASAAGVPFRSNTLGRNLLDPRNDQDAMAFISASDDTRFLIKDGYCFARRADTGQDGLYRLDAPAADNLLNAEPERAAAMKRQVDDFYHSSKYLLYHNDKTTLEQAAPVP
ncbi:MAG: sulfatase-like hydrolase/transferase [Desulfovibrionaceae bacterium]|nr:sulfatase-like hydrolase/transferase [Desulfovibrionaceae bacterium]